MKIRIKDKVSWNSQAGGYYRKKAGTVVARVNRNQDPEDVVRRLKKKHTFRISKPFGQPRDHASFMVLVPGEGAKQRPTLYWPRVSNLQTA